MDTVKISFCNSNGFSISNIRSKTKIINSIKERYSLDIFNNNNRIYNDYILDILKKNKYLLCCLITNARPYIMYITKIYNDNVCLLIDLKIKDNFAPNIIAVPLSIDYDNYKETIILGDLYKNSKTYKWEYLLEKCVVFKGRPFNSNNQIKNLNICNDIIKNIGYNILTPFNISLKEFCSISEIGALVNRNVQHNLGIKIYGLKTPVVYYFSKKYMPNSKYTSVKLINYTLKKSLQKDKDDLIKTFSLTEGENNDNNDNLIKIIENDIDIEREFILKMKKSSTYGIFELFSKNNKIGISRITTIELQNKLIEIFKKRTHISVSAYYNYNFDKWNVERIVDDSTTDSDIVEINNHVEFLKGLSKSNYVLENC